MSAREGGSVAGQDDGYNEGAIGRLILYLPPRIRGMYLAGDSLASPIALMYWGVG